MFTFGVVSSIAVSVSHMAGVDKTAIRIIEDDILGHFSRQAVASRLNKIGRCEFEFTMNGIAYRMQGVLDSQDPLIKITNNQQNQTFTMRLNNREISLSDDSYYGGYPRKIGEHSTYLDASDANLDQAIRHGMENFGDCQSTQSETMIARVPEENVTFVSGAQ